VVRHQTRKAKLDLNTSAGTFLGYTATDKNVIYRDSVTGRFKTATHVVFDEAGMTLPAAERSPAAKVLQELGYGQQLDDSDETDDPIDEADMQGAPPDANLPPQTILPRTTSPVSVAEGHCHDSDLQVKCLSINAMMPQRATDGSAGYDLFSAVDLVINPRKRCAIPLDIAITPPIGTYAQLMSRSGLSLKHQIDVRAGTIDRDFTGNVQVILDNSGDAPYKINIGDRIAQMVLVNIQTPPVQETQQIQSTDCGTSGFGSTGIHGALSTPLDSPAATVHQLEAEPPPVVAATVSEPQKPYDLYFSTDPFDQTLAIDVPIKGDHPTLGILTDFCDARQRLQVRDMALSTPGSRLKKWRTVIRKSYILKFNDFSIQSQQDLEHAISQTRLRRMLKAKLVIATDRSYGVDPMEGILQIHFDQLNTIAKHLEDIKRDQDAAQMATLPSPTQATVCMATPEMPVDPAPPPAPPPEELAQAFTKKATSQTR